MTQSTPGFGQPNGAERSESRGRHRVASARARLHRRAFVPLDEPYVGVRPRLQLPSGVVSSVSFVSTTNTARSLAGFVSLALALTRWRSPGSSEKRCRTL